MKLNYDKLHEFLKVDDYGYYDSRSISLNELYDNPDELTVNELMNLLDYIYCYTDEQGDYSETAAYCIKLKFGATISSGDDCYLLEMKWPTVFDKR